MSRQTVFEFARRERKPRGKQSPIVLDRLESLRQLAAFCFEAAQEVERLEAHEKARIDTPYIDAD
jgi:hypothetical protein